jgi:hypothetical protein
VDGVQLVRTRTYWGFDNGKIALKQLPSQALANGAVEEPVLIEHKKLGDEFLYFLHEVNVWEVGA